MTHCKKIFFKLVFFFAFGILILIDTKAQPCSGSWAVGSSLNWGCINGVALNLNNNLEPPGCPINPSYTSEQTNTFTFNNPVSSFTIDFRGFSTAAGCARLEIKINGLFYPLSASNLVDIPVSVGCGGSFDFILLTSNGYITSTPNSINTSNGHGRIIIGGVNATSVTISTNDAAGTIVSTPFDCLLVVPLKLITFNGQSNLCKAQLNWETGIELNIKNIQIERSEDGSIFNKVGEISSKGSNSQYSFITSNSKDTYFRLKINDLDGTYEYSETIYLKSTCNKHSYTVIPNPVSTQLEIVGLKSNNQVLILDMLGNVVKNFNSSQSNNTLNMQSLPAGMYTLKVINGKSISSLKVIKY